MKKQLALLTLGLAMVLVLAGQLARAAVPKAALPNDSSPYWSWDARTVAFQEETSGVNEVGAVPAGHGPADIIRPGVPRGWRPSGTTRSRRATAATYWKVGPAGTRSARAAATTASKRATASAT